VKTININPTVAWKINEVVSLGFGLNAQYLDAELTQRTFAGPAGNPLISVTGDDWGWGWNIGAMFTLSPATRIGVSYRSQIDYTIEGDITASPNIPAAGLVNGPARADIDVPAMFSIALSQQIGRDWQILADYTYTWWDSIKTLSIVRSNTGATFTTLDLEFKNSWRLGVGANYRLNDQWKLRFGTAYDKTPVQDAFRSPRLPDADRIWLAIGAQWQFSKQGAVDFGYAHEFVDDASSNLRIPPPPAPAGLPGGRLVGTYKADVNIFGIQLKYSF
jgi:long-chain fatty acid transport protein